jgi:hypothetical protein
LSYPEHEKDRFFKYASAKTAVAILASSAVRYSSPLLFNDPFDVQSGLHFRFDMHSLPERLFARMEALVMADATPAFAEPDQPWPRVITFMREKKSSHGFPRDELRQACLPLFTHLKEEFVRYHTQYQQMWIDFLPRLRVFSVAEEKDSLLMWSHYAEHHTGVVLEFLVLPEEDNPLCVAEPVVYSPIVPSPFAEDHLLDFIVGLKRLELDALCLQYARVKSDVWKYEKEWRVWDILPQREAELHSDYPLRPRELAGVYLGCRIDRPMKETILSMLIDKYPQAAVYQASKSSDAFALTFERAI